ncbi:ABC transporter ATP-binding protein [Sulfitobacter albidus]|uniref:ABC transporter ATP-binding protein n=1 Tax=Sulfitobacter albidus TaxID=2829501 RepID=A0A975PLM5_9RHOB|nr:ABC transporter ATP-binding protein [Sulfitobacter albidus]QUJ75844.1 ABC transporter ATP-binding protein [Sulfitobacter albidus]
MPDPLIDLDAVRVSREGRVTLDDVSLRSDARRIGVLGRNGSGKTTLARVIAGLQEVEDGRVRIAGIDVARDRRGALGAVGILFQNPDSQIIFPAVGEELAFGLTQLGAGDVPNRVAEILAQFGRSDWHDAAIHRLSQGQKQLVCLMAVLAMAPRVIVLDEPFAGLDIPTAMHLRRVLEGIDATLVQITHDPASVADYEALIWLDGGRVQAQGGAEVARAYAERMAQIGAGDDLTHLSG